ncbi:hypothetical protein AB1Y20_016139 [Prymnesium parvum]|uniref:Uncharacterized protein n=1 Tax=Prymnesium parvum TaxID=97485 RepID=A0AB34JYP9_PRYPA
MVADLEFSTHRSFKFTLKKLVIGEAATAATEVDAAFGGIQITWPKIIGYDNSTPAPSIDFALSLFPAGYARAPYLAAVQMFQDGGGRWSTFAEFRTEIVERLKIMDARDGPPIQSAFPVMHARGAPSTGEKRMHASNCRECDISFCDGKDCIVFVNKATVKATGSAKRLVHYLRMYAKEKGLVSQMAGVTGMREMLMSTRAISP